MNWELLDRQSARLYEDLYVLEILLNCWNKEKDTGDSCNCRRSKKSMQTACENGEYRQRDLMKEFSVSVIFYKFMEVKQYITRMPFRIEYFQQKRSNSTS